jgi:hypothetical protein
MNFGRNRGCSFLTTEACSTSPEYCQSGSGITFYHSGQGNCRNSDFFSACKVMFGYSNRMCKDPGFSGFYSDRAVTLDTPGWNAEAFLATVIAPQYYPPSAPQVRCFRTACNADGTISVTIGRAVFLCSTGGQTISSASF